MKDEELDRSMNLCRSCIVGLLLLKKILIALLVEDYDALEEIYFQDRLYSNADRIQHLPA